MQEETSAMIDEDIFVLDSDVAENFGYKEDMDYIMVHDPMSDDPDAWCVILMTDQYEDYVVRFDNIGINAKTQDLVYSYQVLNAGEDNEPEDMTHFNNTLTSVLTSVLVSRHKAGNNVYTNLEDIKDSDE